jgi:hypothetical protein
VVNEVQLVSIVPQKEIKNNPDTDNTDFISITQSNIQCVYSTIEDLRGFFDEIR